MAPMSSAPPPIHGRHSSTRKDFLKGAAAAGAGTAGLGMLAPAAALAKGNGRGAVTHGDLAILKAAQIAEALAVTTYTNIINTAPFFQNLASDDQGYFEGGCTGGDVSLSARGKPHQKALTVHHVLLPSEDVRRCTNDAQRRSFSSRQIGHRWSGHADELRGRRLHEGLLQHGRCEPRLAAHHAAKMALIGKAKVDRKSRKIAFACQQAL